MIKKLKKNGDAFSVNDGEYYISQNDASAIFFIRDGGLVEQEYDFNQKLIDAKQRIINYASKTRLAITENADPYKVAGWNDKAQRAERVVAGNATAYDIQVLEAEIARRNKGETVIELANTQLLKAHFLSLSIAVIDGFESAALESLTEVKDVTQLDVVIDGWKATAEAELNELLKTV